MPVKRLLLVVSVLVLSKTNVFGQPLADTSAILTQLNQAETIEMQQPEKALRDYREALTVSQKTGYTKGYFESVRLITYLLDVLGRHGESEKLATEALQKALREPSEQYRSQCHFALAQSAKWQGNNKEAIRHFKLAAPYMLAHQNRKKAAVLSQNLGLIYEAEKLYPQALAYYNRAIRYDQIAKSTNQELAVDYHSVASVYVKQNRLKEALVYYRKTKALLDTTKDLSLLINLYSNIANLHNEEARYDSALFYYQKALRLNRRSNNPLQELHLLAGQAATYNGLNQFARAKPLLDRAHDMAKTNRVGLSEFRNIYREYANASHGLGDYKTAFSWYQQYAKANDSLSTREAKELLGEYEVKLRQAEAGQQLAEKQRRIEQLEQAQQRQKLWLLVAGLVGLSVVSGLVFAYFYMRQRRRTADNALLAAERAHELAVVQSELQGQQKERLRISKEMHDDLGASLTTIGLLSEVVKTRMNAATLPEIAKISAISADMVTAMNEIIWSLNTKNDSLNGLIAYTRAFASEFIEDTALLLRTQVSESPREIAMRGADRRNVFLTVKEALHNVVKHAQAMQVWLTIRPETNRLVIEVADDGRGFAPHERSRFRNGLGNMKNRMGESGGTCDISSSPTGTRVTILYPYPTAPTAKNTAFAVWQKTQKSANIAG
ncbi:tetratricopeptide repeat protein [Larkinella sp.]|uniref:tetratricopeptide repeat protein n=1 Tax=Larkinella sp. TaxID=2034517 RepID=UPI003BA941A6